MTNRRGRKLNRGRKALLALAGALTLGGPVIVGVLIGFGQLPEIHAQARVAPPPVLLAQFQPALPTVAAPLQQDSRLIVTLFDLRGASADEQDLAKLKAYQYIQNEGKPQDVAAVMAVVSGSVQVVQDFTGDVAKLTPAIQNLTGDSTVPPATDAPAVIESVANMLKVFPQKKILLYLSNRATHTVADPAALRHSVAAATAASVAIVPIDIGTVVGQPAGVSPDESRVAYAISTFGAKSPMAKAYIRYGAPDQTEDRGTSQVWRYNFLDDYHGGAAFEFPKGSFSGVRILYPLPEATFEGNAADVAQLAPLTGGLRGGANAADIQSGFPGSHISIQVYPAAPGVAPSPDTRFVPVSIPLESLSGTVDVIGQIRTRLDNGEPGQIMAQLADTAHAPSATYQAGFTLRPGSYVCQVLVRETSTGRMFGEVANFEVK